MNKLIEIAKTVPKKAERAAFTDDEIELVLAWARGEVTIRGVCKATGRRTGNVYVFLAHALRQFVNK